MLERFLNSGLHDYEMVSIEVNYSKAQVSLLLREPQEGDKLYCIEKFSYFEISHKEPWGKGKYICSSDLYRKNNDEWGCEIELNSGDIIKVEFQKVE